MVEVPIIIDRDSALDLEFVSKFSGLPEDKVIAIFLGRIYTVFMLGFLPGFAYMGEVDGRIAAPRKQTPRVKVPKGSVGLAGKQTGVYPLESPGGWQIIGRTDMKIFDPTSERPCPLEPGDEVKFLRI
jgi:KipI family sensor histidine kinase inhibitor